MVTKEQARHNTQFHYGTCTRTVGKRGGIRIHVERWRKTSMMKTWKTRPADWRIAIKYGLKNHMYMTQSNAQEFHLESKCPVLFTQQESA